MAEKIINLSGSERFVPLLAAVILGSIIPNVLGIIDHSIGFFHLLISYLHFILVVWLVWTINRYGYVYFSNITDWLKHPNQRLYRLLLLCATSSLPITFALLYLWYQFPGADFVDWRIILLTCGILFFTMVGVTNLYETKGLIQHLSHLEKPHVMTATTLANAVTIHRFTGMRGDMIIPVKIDAIACFFARDKLVFLQRNDGEVFRTDYSLKELEEILPTQQFFRANRQYILHVENIKSYQTLKDSKILLKLHLPDKTTVIISERKAMVFRKWIVMAD